MYSLELLRGSYMHGKFVFAHIWCNFPCCLPGGTNVPCMEVPRKSSNKYVPLNSHDLQHGSLDFVLRVVLHSFKTLSSMERWKLEFLDKWPVGVYYQSVEF